MIINGKIITKAFIVAQPWVDKFFSENPDEVKTWEMRSTGTKIRGEVGIIEKGTGLIVGTTTIVDSLEQLTISELIATMHKHRVDYKNNPHLIKWNKPWVLKDSKRIEPVPYTHPQGAVIWVNV
ncbi:hypothetical protein OTK49_02935 [Vibrio coralliirubri]|uniref:hypothetical protein n=1 Tax=Vibrio coralliirubri TaxID=1516159 RepID=UPI0022835DF4|nr:hypothetical protein [Vibrio coralliirubri]MCY9861470.1 hypothetical protein [Vibrio coralliirubri]